MAKDHEEQSSPSVSAKSLSGHKMVHSPASTSQPKLEDISNRDGGPIRDQSKTILRGTHKQEILKKSQMGLGDSISGLRGNPKKEKDCSECGKSFSTLKAVAAHMRSHSSAAERDNVCKICGKGFDSMRALFGHMRHHPKKSRLDALESAQENKSENLCPVKRKRSKTRYNKITAHFHMSNVSSSSSSSVSEANEAEEAAACLIMLSTGITNWAEFKASLNQIDGTGKPQILADENPTLKRRGSEKLDEIKSEDKSLEMGLDFCNGIHKKKGHRMRTLKKIFDSSAGNGSSSGTALLSKDEANPINIKLEENQNPNEVESEMIKRGGAEHHECTVCFRNFSSGRALGGHKRAHYSKQRIDKEGDGDSGFDPAPLMASN